MSVPHSKEARRYYRVAYQRLEDGRLLFDRLERYPAAIYLSGYAVECILKAMILEMTPSSKQTEVVKGFRGPRAHNVLALYEDLRSRGSAAFPVAITDDLMDVSTWSVDLRYNPSEGDEDEAREFLDAVTRILNFAEKRLG